MAFSIYIALKTSVGLSPTGEGDAVLFSLRIANFHIGDASGGRTIEDTPYGGGDPVGYDDVEIAERGLRRIWEGGDCGIRAGDSMRGILLRETLAERLRMHREGARAPSSLARRFREFDAGVRKGPRAV